MSIARRTIVSAILGLGSCTVFRIGLGPSDAAQQRADSPECVTELMRCLPDTMSVVSVGNAYLATLERPLSTSELVQQLPPVLSSIRRHDELTRFGGRVLIDSFIRKDFEQGNIISLDGWILSSTEVTLCALASSFLGQAS
jgi:hypothetical protein